MAEEEPAEESFSRDSDDEDKFSPSTYVSPQMSMRSRSEYHTAATDSQYSDAFQSISSRTFEGEEDVSLEDLTNEVHFALDEG